MVQVIILSSGRNKVGTAITQLATIFLYSVQNTFVFFLFLCTEVNSLDSSSFGCDFKELVSAFIRFKSGVIIKADDDCSMRLSDGSPVVSSSPPEMKISGTASGTGCQCAL